ncbi:hypothetical protein M433DRAFT_7248 [Acidomyces richmondensis BFW]|nr:hypothetical protein M433DRAFT_7248 [Acidomyces richmondensis BFW]
MTSKPLPSATGNTTPGSKPPCRIHPSAVIADKAQITGTYPVEIGENVIIHPYARIRADHGKVIIGKNSMVYENATVGLSDSDPKVDHEEVSIGEGVNIETGAVVEARSVGDGTTIEVNAIIGKGAVVGKYCKIVPLETVGPGEVLDDFSVLYGAGQRIDTTTMCHPEIREAKRVGQEKAVELMKKLIPNSSAKWA